MEKIKTTLETLREDISTFYKPEKFHFLTVNGIDLCDGTLELQWIFSEYGVKDKTIFFSALIKEDDLIPSINDLVPSAFMGEREIVDMFGLDIEGMEKGLYLDEDGTTTPLRCQS